MKKYIFLLISLALLYACGAAKKTLHQASSNETFVSSVDSQSVKVERVVDTTKTEQGKITITEIEFYPPTPNRPDAPTNAPPTLSNAGGVDVQNIGTIKDAAIKSIKQTTIETGTKQKGESKETTETVDMQGEAIVSKGNQELKESIAPVPDPYRWRYIFYILALIAGILLYLKRMPVLNWIKTILTNIRRIF